MNNEEIKESLKNIGYEFQFNELNDEYNAIRTEYIKDGLSEFGKTIYFQIYTNGDISIDGGVSYISFEEFINYLKNLK